MPSASSSLGATTAPTAPSVPTMSSAQLRALVRRYAQNPNLATLLPESKERTWARLAGDRRTDVWLISWPEGTATGWHDHGAASGAFAVASGSVVEETWARGSVQRRLLTEGDYGAFGPEHVHYLYGIGPGRSLSVHAYAPGLVRMGRFVLEAGGPIPVADGSDEVSR